jgi:molecular chaperone GrpE
VEHHLEVAMAENYEEDENTNEKPRIHVVDRRHWASEEDEDGEGRSEKPTYVAELEGKLAAAEDQVRTIRQQYRDAKADLEAERARLRRELKLELDASKKSLLGDLIGVLDDLDLALTAARETDDDSGLRSGVELVHQRFLGTLEKLGVQRLSSLGAPFDPDVHEAISAVPVGDPEQDNVVVGVVKEAYRLGDEVLRHGQVAVGKLSETNDPKVTTAD